MMRVLTLIILALLLTACASDPVVITRTVYQYPPKLLIQPTEQPDYTGSTWGDLARYSVKLQARLMECNADKRALREWAQAE